jgi:predicted Zn finger-like uncharacterized protein
LFYRVIQAWAMPPSAITPELGGLLAMRPLLAHHRATTPRPYEPKPPMQIVCPACSAAYEVPLTLLKPGQGVRCARCAGEWVPMPAAPEPVVAVPAGADSADDEAPMAGTDIVWPAPMPAPRANVALRLAWAVSIAAVLLLVWGGYAERAAIMHGWPPSIRLYAALGLAGDR